MFYGEFEHTIDLKGRLIIPAKFREISKSHYIEKFYLTRGLDNCLFLFTEDEWKLQEQKFKSLSFTKKETRKFNRIYFSGACELTIDKQGRILIPKVLQEFAEIRREIMIIGVSNRIEIWDKQVWQDFYKSSKDSFEELAEKILDLE